MLNFIQGDLFQSDCEAWVNTVNCVGVMGKGIALSFKNRFPVMFKNYKEACINDQVVTGRMHIFKNDGHPKWIINFPTKNHWRNPSEYEYIVNGLESLKNTIAEKDIKSICIPALGCSNGQLQWSKVKKIIEEWAVDVPIRIDVMEPFCV